MASKLAKMDAHTCLLLGSAGMGVVKEEFQRRLAPKPKPSDTPKVGKALSEALNDIVCLTDLLQGVVRFTKKQVMDALRRFCQPSRKFFWLTYSGHGEKGKGNWSCYDGFITLKEILAEWRDSGNEHSSSKKLFIFSDCCYTRGNGRKN